MDTIALAKRGAVERLRELRAEITHLETFLKNGRPIRRRTRTRRAWTAAKRRQHAAMMRKRWRDPKFRKKVAKAKAN